jgi:hypothetical protein
MTHIYEIKPDPTIRLTAPDGRCAVIDFGGKEVTYSGDLPVSEAAQIFFNAVGNHLRQALHD